MNRIISSDTRDEILANIEFINTIHPTSLEYVNFKYPSMPFLDYFKNKQVPFKTFGTLEGISDQINSITDKIGLVYCFIGYVSATGAYILTAFAVEIEK